MPAPSRTGKGRSASSIPIRTYGWCERKVPSRSTLFFRGDFVRRRHLVQHEPAADFFHRDALGFMRDHTMRVGAAIVVSEAHAGTAPQLLCAHCRDIDVKKSTFDRGRLDRRDRSGLV